MLTEQQINQIELTKYNLLGRGSHSASDIQSAQQLAVLIEIICPIIERNTKIMEKILEQL